MIVFGSTGSIGVNALALAATKNMKISALACGENIKLLNEQIERFKPEFVCIKNHKDKSLVKHKRVFVGQEGLEKILKECEDELFLNAIVGFAGLRSSLKAKECHKNIALANKESLVVAGEFLKGAKIIPIDSEHSALKFLLQKHKNVKKLYITASGGAFWKSKIKDLQKVSAKDALKHPTWEMGAKITIDSATMANKLFEIIEAYHLYGFKDIDALIEPKSIIHALCEFKNGSSTAYFSYADMKLAISQAIFKKHNTKILEYIDFVKLSGLKFYRVNERKYPIFKLKNELLNYPSLGVLINAANEVLVYKFLKGKCGFLDISKGIFKVLNHFGIPKLDNILAVFEYDTKVREYLR
ncbi:1-deoxy-D-xylulose-5-phosphate reductoisomerase [Campylobacter cuniculorum]|uniref:1-deoxy-D-xylulose 5-phosphate reductoisomerase n=2 Tax=Campylobacter cuniculorum TaxID=374106 RepID=A0A1W6BUK9_9BACT|nr:1-deoxy-D-xylulose-5-phosphate reductoisomerase [Campylobacter cuniculorum]ARJ55768.1 1-deoxy-D-xylulose 5-phosphate reductoisomerase [Campylobacter cuniculorum DSM 23162 = LMG 24588]QOR04988.1 1-deoxy-D-xylulose-5-phosphate reductoisomerase [Campylobacter cuniculorum]